MPDKQNVKGNKADKTTVETGKKIYEEKPTILQKHASTPLTKPL